jgi:hypothetical protein
MPTINKTYLILSYLKVSFSSGGRVARVCTCLVLSVDVRSLLPRFVYVMSL